MVLKVKNTMSGEMEEFLPVEKKKVRIYVCGLTPYDDMHIGHLKTYINFDVIRRYFEYRGYDVTYVQNITDVEDKIMNRARERGVEPLKLSDEYNDKAMDLMKKLHIKKAKHYPKASKHIKEIIAMIEALEKGGYTYQLDDGVYFDISKFKEYGKLSHQSPDELNKHRIEPNPDKRNPADFALWKRAKPGELSWKSNWGDGRPGWHIECSAMATKYLGNRFEIHGGGGDLRFPHHENEIAQSEAATGEKPFVKYWLHTGFLNVDGEKMSKSLGNFITVDEVLKKHAPDEVRFFFVSVPYDGPIDYTEGRIGESTKALHRIYNILDNLDFIVQKKEVKEKNEAEGKVDISAYRDRFFAAMNNNFNTAEAFSVVFEFVRELNALLTANQLCNTELISDALNFLKDVGEIMGIDLTPLRPQIAPHEVLDLIASREEARKNKEWKRADELRDKVTKLGWTISDTPHGAKLRRIKGE